MPSRWPRQQVRNVVDRFPHRVEHPAKPGRRRPHLACGVGDHRAAAAPDPFKAGERHHHGIAAGKADDLAGNEAVAPGFDHDPGTDRHRVDRAGDLDHQAADAHHSAINIDAIDVTDLLGKGLHCENLKF